MIVGSFDCPQQGAGIPAESGIERSHNRDRETRCVENRVCLSHRFLDPGLRRDDDLAT